MLSDSDLGLATLQLMKHHRKCLLPALIVLTILLSGCANSTEDRESAFQGRWHRVAKTDVGDPFQTLASEYIEFHPNGVLASLLFDKGPQLFWTTMMGEYLVSDSDHVNIRGKCWQGWQSYDCSRMYRFELKGDTLTIFDNESEERLVAFERIRTVSSNLPPTLIPPMPSATPSGK